MRSLLIAEQYKRDVRRLHKKRYDLSKLTRTVEILRQNGAVPVSQSPHKLHGKWSTHWECHIEDNWILVYKVDAVFVYLYRTGTHDDLF